ASPQPTPCVLVVQWPVGRERMKDGKTIQHEVGTAFLGANLTFFHPSPDKQSCRPLCKAYPSCNPAPGENGSMVPVMQEA
ncbi:hypothetical protein NL385_27425, partial [Klebsiella pneumoniae]|nr:hypothetical protein [Klebsiella pneumoniae]